MSTIKMFLFMIGACFGSFMCVIAYRLPRSENFIRGRSHCERCCHQLRWYELIPVLSYIIFKGRCHHCQQKISVLYPVIECICGLLFIQCFEYYDFSIQMVIVFSMCLDLLVIALIDQQTMDIYLSTIVIFLLLTLVFRYLQGFQNINIIMDCLCVSLPMLLNVVVPDSFGFGDVELMFVSGIMLGWVYNLLAMSISILSAGLYAGYLLLIKKVDKKGHIAFGPFLVFGILTSLFYGSKLLICYFRVFF